MVRKLRQLHKQHYGPKYSGRESAEEEALFEWGEGELWAWWETEANKAGKTILRVLQKLRQLHKQLYGHKYSEHESEGEALFEWGEEELWAWCWEAEEAHLWVKPTLSQNKTTAVN